MKKRLVIITEIIAPYRIPVFNALSRRSDVDPHIIFLSQTDPSLREWTVDIEEIQFSYQVLPSFRRRVGKYNLLLNRGVTPALRQAKPDVVLCGGYNYVASWQAIAWCRRNSIPMILWVESTAHDRRRGYKGIELLKERFIGWSDAFVVPGRSSADYLKSFGIPLNSIFYAPNSVDTDLFSDSAHLQQDFDSRLPAKFFLFVGRLVPEKGVFDLLTAYEKLPRHLRREFGLVIAGSGIARPELESWTQRISPGSIVFTGFLQKHQLAHLYARAYALVFPTHSDPWGLVVNEALASGLPVIASSVAGCVADLVEDGTNGRIVSSGSASQLSAAIEWLARNPDSREKMSAKSRERSKQYSPEACAAGMAQAANAMESVFE